MINDDDFKIFPVRFGGSVGKAIENKMLDAVGGANSIRTRIIGNTMLRTRGGFPEFTTLKEPVAIESVSRTFVFRNIGASTGVVANRNGSDMKVVVPSLTINAPCCAVSSFRGGSRWNDVIRIDNDKVLTNGIERFDVSSVTSVFLPYVSGSSVAAVTIGDATRSNLFLGICGSQIGVSSIGVNGESAEFVGPTYPTLFIRNSGDTAGVRVDSNGRYRFYGAYYTVTYAAYPIVQLANIGTSHCVVATAVTSPFLTLESIGNAALPSFPGLTPVENSAQLNANTRALTYTPPVPASKIINGVAYAGSDIECYLEIIMACNSTRTVNDGIESGLPYGETFDEIRTDTAAVKSMHNAIGIIASSQLAVQGDASYSGTATLVEDLIYSGVWTLLKTITSVDGSTLATSTCFAKDFIFADIDEEITLTFELSIISTCLATPYIVPGSLTPDSTGYKNNVCKYSASFNAEFVTSYVLNIRGAKHILATSTTTLDQVDSDNWLFSMFVMLGRKPTDVAWPGDRPYSQTFFAPRYMSQGNCEFIAHTTKAEELAGDVAECYLDMIVQPVGYTQSANMGGGVVKFVPHNILAMLGNTSIISATGDTKTRIDQINTWVGVGTNTRLQFANGTSGPWQGKLGAGFSNGSQVEISRI